MTTEFRFTQEGDQVRLLGSDLGGGSHRGSLKVKLRAQKLSLRTQGCEALMVHNLNWPRFES